jgi:DNA-directed RNA polymerase subunit M/transcription elongation factor TFIIS
VPKKGVPRECPTCERYGVEKQERARASADSSSTHVLVTYKCGHTFKSRSKVALHRLPPKG